MEHKFPKWGRYIWIWTIYVATGHTHCRSVLQFYSDCELPVKECSGKKDCLQIQSGS